MTAADIRILPYGETALLVDGPPGISDENFHFIRNLEAALTVFVSKNSLREQHSGAFSGLRSLVPAYRSLLLIFDPFQFESGSVIPAMESLALGCSVGSIGVDAKLVEIPVLYGDGSASSAYGPDLPDVAARTGLSATAIIARHAGASYRVCMIGFTPGFPYLVGMPPQLACPRRSSPRVRIEAGSVGIADAQTGVYPLASPGGWNIIGRTPLRLFDPAREPAALLSAGIQLRFVPIDEATFHRIETEEAAAAALRRSAQAAAAPESADLAATAQIEVLASGPMTSVQDLGRPEAAPLGVSRSGAMDSFCIRLANLVIGNEAAAAALEFTFIGPRLRFLAPCRFALAGGIHDARLSDRPVHPYESIEAAAGDILDCGSLSEGIRGYIAFAGGIDVPEVLGSRSTSLRAGFGGFGGRLLAAGDRLALCRDSSMVSAATLLAGARAVPETLRPRFDSNYVLRVMILERELFTAEALATFSGATWKVTPSSDRMGIRLEGPALAHSHGADIVSSGVIPGTIQVPGQGQPILLGADCQTTGGYPRIAQICAVDLPILGRLKPGDTIHFQTVTALEALEALLNEREALADCASWPVPLPDPSISNPRTVVPTPPGPDAAPRPAEAPGPASAASTNPPMRVPQSPQGQVHRYRISVDGQAFEVEVRER